MASLKSSCNCDDCRFYNLCGGCRPECNHAGCMRPCSSCPVRCRRREDVDAWIRDVGGTLDLSFPRTVDWPPVPGDLPPVIPEVDGYRTAEYDAAANYPAYAVGASRVFSKKGAGLRPRWRGRRAAGVLGLPPGKKVVLHMFGPDELIERLWTEQFRCRLWDQVAGAEFALVLGPNYSIYGEHPRFEHLINMRRSLLAAVRLASLGVPVAPNVYWWTERDLERWCGCVEKLKIPAVEVNAQTYRTEKDWAFLLAGLARMGERLGDRVIVFLNGLSQLDRIVAARKVLPRVIFLSRDLQMRAQHGRLFGARRGEYAYGEAPVLFRKNVELFQQNLHLPTLDNVVQS